MKIYYDGVCKLCTGFVSLTKRFSKKGTFVFIPLQEATIKIPENFSNTVIVETNEGKLFAYAIYSKQSICNDCKKQVSMVWQT